MTHPPRLSIVVPVYNQAGLLRRALESIRRQETSGYELIVVDDGSPDDSAAVAREYADRVLVNPQNVGPARTRNRGIRESAGEVVAFLDSDCEAQPGWLSGLQGALEEPGVDVVMGGVWIPPSTFLGDSISALGFPAGGSLGFEKVWHVSPDGFTEHISSCNFAVRRRIFEQHGLFDESFPLAGGEDSELSYRYSRAGVRIRYCAEARVHHVPRKDLSSFVRWQLTQGISNYYFKKKVGPVGSFIRLRVWSSWNVLRAHLFDLKLPAIFLLLGLSFLLQQWGFMVARRRDRPAAG